MVCGPFAGVRRGSRRALRHVPFLRARLVDYIAPVGMWCCPPALDRLWGRSAPASVLARLVFPAVGQATVWRATARPRRGSTLAPKRRQPSDVLRGASGLGCRRPHVGGRYVADGRRSSGRLDMSEERCRRAWGVCGASAGVVPCCLGGGRIMRLCLEMSSPMRERLCLATHGDDGVGKVCNSAVASCRRLPLGSALWPARMCARR